MGTILSQYTVMEFILVVNLLIPLQDATVSLACTMLIACECLLCGTEQKTGQYHEIPSINRHLGPM